MINNSKKDYPTLLFGPVIGKVTENSARIIMEFDKKAFVILELFESPIRINIENNTDLKKKIIPNFIMTKECEEEIPIAFHFESLKENTKYIVHLRTDVHHMHPMLAELECSFRTLNSIENSNNEFRIAFISCNSLKWQRRGILEEFNLWKNLTEKIEKGEVDYCVHLGDQVYLDDGRWDGEKDNSVEMCLSLWRDSYRDVFEIQLEQKKGRIITTKEINAWELELQSLSKAFIRIISEDYRNTFNNYYQARCLRRVPNLMFLEDHDIFDNFGFHKRDTDYYYSFEHFFSEQARFCYYKYQKLLIEDIDFFQNFSKTIIYEHSWHILNGIAIFLQDFRGCRSWSRCIPESNSNSVGETQFFLGKKQQDDIKSIWGPGGLFEKAKAAIYASSTPIVFLSKGPAKLGVKNKIEDCLEQWPLNSRHDQAWILDQIKDFRERTKKNVFIVSGDPHIGVLTKVYKNRKYVFHQIVSSAITQKPPTPLEFSVMQLMLKISKSIGNSYTMKHYKEFNDNNYAIAEFKPDYSEYINESKCYRYAIFAKHVRSNGNRISEDEFTDIGYKFEKDRKHCGCQGCKFI